MSRGELPLWGDEPPTFTKGLKRIGTNQGVATSQLGGTHIHAMHAGGRFGTSAGGNLRLARGELPGLTKGLELGTQQGGTLGLPGGTPRFYQGPQTWELLQWARGLLQWYSGNSRNCHP